MSTATMPDIDSVLREKRNERFSVCLPETLAAAVGECANLSDTSRNDFILTILAREAALQGVLGVNSCEWDDLESSIRRSLCMVRSMKQSHRRNAA